MTSLLLLPICLLTGFCLKRTGVFTKDAAPVLNTFIIWVAFPALVMVLIPQMLSTLHPSAELLTPTLAVWIAFVLTALFVIGAGHIFKWKRSTIGALILTAGLGNTSFVGFPMIEALYGKEGIAFALILDQLGSFLVLSSLGIFAASYYSGQRTSVLAMLKKIVSFPPFLAILAGLAMSLLPGSEFILPALDKLAMTLVPLALISVGCQLHFEPKLLKERLGELSFGLALKLIVIPLFALFFLFGQHDLGSKVTILELGMGPMITGAIVATEFGLDADLANLMVGVGTPLSVLSVLVLNWAL